MIIKRGKRNREGESEKKKLGGGGVLRHINNTSRIVYVGTVISPSMRTPFRSEL